MLKRYKNPAICFYSLFVIAMAVAVFYDLALDIWLNNPGNLFAIWLRNTGEIPSRLICPLAGTVIFLPHPAAGKKPPDFCFLLAAPPISVTISASISLWRSIECFSASSGASGLESSRCS